MPVAYFCTHPKPKSAEDTGITVTAGAEPKWAAFPICWSRESGKPYGSDAKDIGTMREWREALTYARAEWAAALHSKVPEAGVSPAGPGDCGQSAIACARRLDNMIFVVGAGADTDKRAVMLHEFAHLLGVPHIEDDPLMAPAYKQVALHPTPASVALAKLNYRKLNAAIDRR